MSNPMDDLSDQQLNERALWLFIEKWRKSSGMSAEKKRNLKLILRAAMNGNLEVRLWLLERLEQKLGESGTEP